jgi:2-succinyl-5-enolpyruvyl-6-hydroxy-3-cyclohexene-1-carboxylate synthase
MQPGPVQLNLQFVEPLSASEPSALSVLSKLTARSLPFFEAPNQELEIEVDSHTVVIAGAGAGADAVRFAEKANLPLLAEPSSGARYGSSAITNYVQALGTDLADQVRRVVIFGKPTLSRPIIALIKRCNVYVAKSRKFGKFDVGQNAIAAAWQLTPNGRADNTWIEVWKKFIAPTDQRALLAQAAWNATGAIPLLFGASNLIRIADKAVAPAAVKTFANRGLSGIDGTVATAIGIAQAGNGVRALIGDLTLFHDVGSLNKSGLRSLNVQLIIGNDSGGEIFRNLEVSKNIPTDLFDQLFITPQQLSIEALAKAFDWQYFGVESIADLEKAMKAEGFVIIDYKLSVSKA